MAKERRSKIQLYFDIVSAIVEDSQNNDSVSPTRIQFKCNTSYDKLTKYLLEKEKRYIIHRENSLPIGYQDHNTIHMVYHHRKMGASQLEIRKCKVSTTIPLFKTTICILCLIRCCGYITASKTTNS